jgi:hypothetical protein
MTAPSTSALSSASFRCSIQFLYLGSLSARAADGAASAALVEGPAASPACSAAAIGASPVAPAQAQAPLLQAKAGPSAERGGAAGRRGRCFWLTGRVLGQPHVGQPPTVGLDKRRGRNLSNIPSGTVATSSHRPREQAAANRRKGATFEVLWRGGRSSAAAGCEEVGHQSGQPAGWADVSVGPSARPDVLPSPPTAPRNAIAGL